MARPPSGPADDCHQAALQRSWHLSPPLLLPADGVGAPALVAPPLAAATHHCPPSTVSPLLSLGPAGAARLPGCCPLLGIEFATGRGEQRRAASHAA